MMAKLFERLLQIRGRIGVKGIIEAVLHPLTVPLFAIGAWLRTLWEARVLLFGRWQNYQGFHPQNAMTAFFYATQWLNLDRYGRTGVSPVAGLGNYPLSRWFHLSLLSSCIYANAGAVTTLLGTLGWTLMHLVWFDTVDWQWGLAVVAILFFSSTAFAMAFVRQNYNILGWMWLPLGLYAVFQGHWWLATLAWLAAALASITVVIAVVPLLVVHSVAYQQPEALFTVLPALLKLILHLLPMLASGGLGAGLRNIAKMIGLASGGVRYRRTSMRLGETTAYFILLYSLGSALLWIGNGSPPPLVLIALALYVINQRFARFADDQSVILLFVTVYAAALLAGPPTATGFVGLLLVANALPPFLGTVASGRDGTLVRMPALRPFDHGRLFAAMDRFFEPVKPGATVYFAFADPAGRYENLFDGQRGIVELPRFVAARRGLLLLPDWYAVAETNYCGAPDCWGQSLTAVMGNLQRWGASHAVVYQESGSKLDPTWSASGFAIEAVFDWGDWCGQLDGYFLWTTARPPCWWLLRGPRPEA